MEDYEDESPFKNDDIPVRKVVIGNGAVNVGGYAFSQCQELTNVQLADSITELHGYAFYNCENLTTIKLPASLTQIQYDCFEYCSSLTEIVLPEGTKSIGGYAFSDCARLKKIVIPASVTKISDTAFERCPQLSIYAPKGSFAESFAQKNNISFYSTAVSSSSSSAESLVSCEPEDPLEPDAFNDNSLFDTSEWYRR